MTERFPGFRSAANDNFMNERPQRSVPDLAKMASARRVIGLSQESAGSASVWSEEKKAEMKEAVSAFTPQDAIDQINEVTERQVNEKPVYYNALLEIIDTVTIDIQNEAG